MQPLTKKKNVGHCNLFFHGPVILPYILNSMMDECHTFGKCVFDPKINLGHSDLYFSVQ